MELNLNAGQSPHFADAQAEPNEINVLLHKICTAAPEVIHATDCQQYNKQSVFSRVEV